MATRRVLLLLGVACLGSWLVVVLLGTRLTFFNDDWYFLLQRPGLESHAGPNALLAPHNSNLVVFTALSYKVLVAVFGLGTQLWFRVVLGLVIVTVGAMVFLLVRRRSGPVLALAAAVVVLFLGAAWEDLLFYGAAIDIAGSTAAGLVALWLLDRDPPLPLLACLALVCSVGFSNLGVPFALGAATLLLIKRRLSGLWVAVVPLALFAVWWGLAGSDEPSHLSVHNVAHLPSYVLESLTSGLASMTGLHGGTKTGMRVFGPAVLGVVVVGILFALWRGWRPRASVLVPLVIAVSFWCLTGAGFYEGREPFASRYQLIDVVLLALIGAELVGMVRLAPGGVAVVAVVTIGIVSANVADRLASGYRFLRTQSAFAKADLGALELGGRQAPRDLWLLPGVANNPYLSGVTAGRFFAQTAAHGGVPVYGPSQIAAASPDQRQGADHVLALAERLGPQKVAAPAGLRGCARLATGVSGVSPEVVVAPGTWILTELRGAGGVIGVRRFAPPGLPSYIGLIAAGNSERMTVVSDPVRRAWRLSLRTTDPRRVSILRLCPR